MERAARWHEVHDEEAAWTQRMRWREIRTMERSASITWRRAAAQFFFLAVLTPQLSAVDAQACPDDTAFLTLYGPNCDQICGCNRIEEGATCSSGRTGDGSCTCPEPYTGTKEGTVYDCFYCSAAHCGCDPVGSTGCDCGVANGFGTCLCRDGFGGPNCAGPPMPPAAPPPPPSPSPSSSSATSSGVASSAREESAAAERMRESAKSST